MALATRGYHLFMPHGFPGPVALFSGTPDPEVKQAIGRLIITYSKQAPGQIRRIRFGNEIFDPGDPLPIRSMGLKKIGTKH
jgi:hypothetical protein